MKNYLSNEMLCFSFLELPCPDPVPIRHHEGAWGLLGFPTYLNQSYNFLSVFLKYLLFVGEMRACCFCYCGVPCLFSKGPLPTWDCHVIGIHADTLSFISLLKQLLRLTSCTPALGSVINCPRDSIWASSYILLVKRLRTPRGKTDFLGFIWQSWKDTPKFW